MAAKRRQFDLTTTSGKLFHWALNSLRPRRLVKFDMGVWIEKLPRKKGVHGPCGTAACAAGHLALDPKMGGLFPNMRRYGLATVGEVARAMGISDSEAYEITIPLAYGYIDRTVRGAVKKSAVKRRILALAQKYQAAAL